MKRFFDNLPRELFEAAHIDGAGALRVFWSIVLPLSKPILGVVSIFAILAEWKNFLWPFLVLSNSPDRQPLAVRLPASQAQTQLGVLLASMVIAALATLTASRSRTMIEPMASARFIAPSSGKNGGSERDRTVDLLTAAIQARREATRTVSIGRWNPLRRFVSSPAARFVPLTSAPQLDRDFAPQWVPERLGLVVPARTAIGYKEVIR